ncbi:hypothetical protein LG943_20285 [Streptomonospora sp. S1-112]|uniref:Uncharacterized protein n=1 Tax=Streptomonospora mangrovi TaxID=2883123 RepID=A0A9X3NYC7_9ACTN|nr:hypothetical protein [Streptomonospora mangrovi]MDA0566631.1 hypothetical protein [Streptomonospora mangrovi]
MTERAEQLVLQYVSRVGDAAYGVLPSRRRAAYLGELRRRILRACADAHAETYEDVVRVLRGFGRPADLVARELDSAASAASATPTVRPVSESGANGTRADAEGDADGRAADATGSAAPAASASRLPNRPHRPPPPWRGGPDPAAARRARRARAGGAHGAGGARAAAARLPALSLAPLRRHPPEVLAVILYLLSGIVGAATPVWPVGAAIVALSRAWSGRDKAVGLCLPLTATLVGMSLWRGDAVYIDQVIAESLAATGVVGLRLAAVCCGCYLAVRLARLGDR